MKARPRLDTLVSSCSVCGSTTATELYNAKDRLRNSDDLFRIAQCECGVLRTLPAMTDAELARFYPGDYWGGEANPTQRWIEKSQSDKRQFLSRCGLAGGSILDIGCGSGFFLRALDPAKWDRFGVETGEAASSATERAIGSGRVFTGELMQSRWPDSKFDLVTFWSALEHTNDPRANLLEARRVIRSEGSIVIQVPNAASYQARAFRGGWFALDVPRHRYHFTPRVLARLLSETGFEMYRATTFSKAHNSHALKQTLKAKLVTSSSSRISHARFHLAVPFVKPFEGMMSLLGRGATLTVAARAL